MTSEPGPKPGGNDWWWEMGALCPHLPSPPLLWLSQSSSNSTSGTMFSTQEAIMVPHFLLCCVHINSSFTLKSLLSQPTLPLQPSLISPPSQLQLAGRHSPPLAFDLCTLCSGLGMAPWVRPSSSSRAQLQEAFLLLQSAPVLK